MLTDSERREIEATLHHYPHRRSAAAGAMRTVQRHRGWLSDEALADIAGFLGVSVEELDSRATFANMLFRQPVGRHVVLLCDSFACWSLGYDGLRAEVESQLGVGLGGTTRDGRFTLLPIVCLGACDRGPAMMVDADLHGPVAAGDVGAILGEYA